MFYKLNVSLIVLTAGLFFFLNCGINPANSAEDIVVTQPSSGSTWTIYETNLPISWTGGKSGDVSISLHMGDSELETIANSTSNSGSYTWLGPVPDTYIPDTNYRIKIEDGIGEVGWSENFEICSSQLPEDMEFITVPAGSFDMGAPIEEEPSNDNERPVHTVTFDYSFEIMSTEVTQGIWLEVMGSNPSFFTGLDRPVEMVDWYDCQEFVNKVNTLDPYHTYRLPSESEWEYSCRAGTSTRFFWGEDPFETEINAYAWYSGNSGESTHPVAEKFPNPLGLYDINGNVYEWCQDSYHVNYVGAPADGSPWMNGEDSIGVLRGGSWFNDPGRQRSGAVESVETLDRFGQTDMEGDAQCKVELQS